MKSKTYTFISHQTGLSISHVSRVLRKERRPSLRTLLLLSKAMKMPADSLIRKLGLRGIGRWGGGKK